MSIVFRQRIAPLTHPLFILAVVLAAINQWLESRSIFLPLVHSYMDDFLCFPIVFSVGLTSYRLVLSSEKYVLRPIQIWPVVILYTLVFEFILPRYSDVYTSDWRDGIAYICGTVVFLKWINRAG
jgi:hypothetical protein